MNSQNDKIDRYLDRAFEAVPKAPRVSLGLLTAFMMPVVGLSLGFWSMNGGGPEGALTSAHALTWVFIILNSMAIGIWAIAVFGREFVKKDMPVMYDRGLFAIEKRSTFLSKLIARSDVVAWLVLSIAAAWPVAIVFLALQAFAEIILTQVNRVTRNERRKELDKMDEAELHALFATSEEEAKVGDEIDEMFRVDL
jgi:hypothetical protein